MATPEQAERISAFLHNSEPTEQIDIFLQGIALELLGNKDGFHRALASKQMICEDNDPDSAKKKLESFLAFLRAGDLGAWEQIEQIAQTRPRKTIMGRIVLGIKPSFLRLAAR